MNGMSNDLYTPTLCLWSYLCCAFLSAVQLHGTGKRVEARKMDLVGKAVFLVLFTYFSYRCAMSVQKLYMDAENIGTTIKRKRYLSLIFCFSFWPIFHLSPRNSNESPDSSVVTYPSISVCVGSGHMVRFDQPEQFHGTSETSLDNYPLLQVEFTMLDKINSVYDPRDDHRLLISSNDIRENTTLGAMFHTQSVYMPTGGHKEPHKVMKCMTFDPPTPVESGIEHQVQDG